MPRKKTTTKARKNARSESVSQRTRKASSPSSFFEQIKQDTRTQFSYLNLALGALILFVLGVLVFNYFHRPAGQITTSPEATSQAEAQTSADVAKENLPGSYTIKDGDTLFTIAEKYYGDGYQFSKIAEANQLADPNLITAGQIITIPKLDLTSAQAEQSASPSVNAADLATGSNTSPNAPANERVQSVQGGTGGAINQTEWGEKINGDTYTVVNGDWLSTIAGRAYGDIFAYQKLANANGIKNPNLIIPGMVLKIPR